MNIFQIGSNSYHIAESEVSRSMLSRYGVLKEGDRTAVSGNVRLQDGCVVLPTKCGDKEFRFEKRQKGFRIVIPLTEKERIFGLGDATREKVMVRGIRADMHIANVTSYGPMPLLYSADGWGFVLNCTYESIFDCGKTDPNAVVIDAADGEIDFFLFTGDTLKDLQAKITAVTGRAAMLPKFAYGLTLVQNNESDIRSMLWDIRTLRDRGIPCDVMGLEPYWMEKIYDLTTEKDWSRERFPIPNWVGKDNCGTYTFFFPLRQMGMQLSLWLCTEYDIFFAEENNLKVDETKEYDDKAQIFDEHLTGVVRMDHFTKPEEPWFEHLKHFVTQGAAAFKLDGSNQIMEHPDRLWGGKYTDDEVHNIYPVLLARQISDGFYNFTDRRLLLYTAGAYLGTQQYAATWAGDTGGDQRTMVSLMNYAMCGHSNTSCDIDVTSKYSIHYGFLAPWSQYFCWDNWRYPWFLREEMENLIRFYANLRSSLIPYIYTAAHTAAATGLPIMRPLPLMYEETDRFDRVRNAYMMGDSLYVGAFDMKLELPEGNWIDYWNGDRYEGNQTINYEIPEGRGGALLVREGSIIMTMKPQKYILEKQPDYVLQVFPGKDCEFTLYEDDGFTKDYENGGFAETRFTLTDSAADGFTLTVYPRTGGFTGRPDNGSDPVNNSVPTILPTPPQRDMTVEIESGKPLTVTVNGAEIPTDFDGRKVRFPLSAEILTAGTVNCQIKA